MLRREHQREAANQLAIGNIITTMRLISASDWPVFVEQVSVVERILKEDPVGAYARMDFPTRDRYRHSVEQLARGAKTAGARRRARARWRSRARGAPADPQNDRRHHVGYYLISRGRFRLEAGPRLSADRRRAGGEVPVPPSGDRLPRRDGGGEHRADPVQLSVLRGAPRRDVAGAPAGHAVACFCRSASWRSTC